jgi:D-alanyl-D-alanine carboxypeptidase/D-alanyl-D-alanine-endopeptidase (penicillin-binding protein 4)
MNFLINSFLHRSIRSVSRRPGDALKADSPIVQMVYRQLNAAFITLLLVGNLNGASLQDRVKSTLTSVNGGEAGAGVLIQDLHSDSVLVAINADKPFIPASVTKLVTGAVACELLGPQFIFSTSVYLDRPLNRDSGTVHGNLYIRGGGDPGFTAERMWLFVQHLRHCGIRRIDQAVILDETFFDSLTTGPGFDEDNSSRAYDAPTSALAASFNCVAVHVAPGNSPGAAVIVQPFPAISGVSIISNAKTVIENSPAGIQVETRVVAGKTAIVVSGKMGQKEKPRYIYRKVFETWQNFGWVLQGLFAEADIVLAGPVLHGHVPDSLLKTEPFYVFESQPLAEFLNNMFKYSSNFAAEMLFKTIAAHQDSLPGSWQQGARKIENWWRADSLPGEPIIVNGSGMGKSNRLSPRQIGALLSHVWRQKNYAPEYISALSVAGVDGTLGSRFTSSAFKGVIRAKTGTLNDYGVSNIAGYVLLPDRTLSFVILVNATGSFSQYAAWTMQEKILETVLSNL